MNQNKIVNLLNRVLKTNGTKLKKLDEYMYWSPFISHHKPKLQINVKTQKWHCWVSGTGGRTLFQLLKKVNASNQHFDELRELVGDLPHYKKETDTRLKKVVQLPYEFITFGNSTDSIVKRHALSYLYKRGITDSDMLKYNIGYCDEGMYRNRIIIPSYDETGELNFFVGRDFYNGKMKYRNSPTTKNVVGFELLINWECGITIVEGVMDAFAVKRNAIPLFGKVLSNNLKLKILNKRPPFVNICLDNDAILASINIIEFLYNNDIEVRFIKLPEKKDPSEIGFKDLLSLIEKTNKIKFSDLIKLKLEGFN